VRDIDDSVDNMYISILKKASHDKTTDIKCTVSATLILRYVERIADHATYIGESVLYIVTGERTPRK